MVTRTHKRALHRHALPKHALHRHALPKHALHRHALPKHALPNHALHRRTRKQRGGEILDKEYTKLDKNTNSIWPGEVYVHMKRTPDTKGIGFVPVGSNCTKEWFSNNYKHCDGYFPRDAFSDDDKSYLSDDGTVLIKYNLYKFNNAKPPVVELLNNIKFLDINFGMPSYNKSDMPSYNDYMKDIPYKVEKKNTIGIIHFNEYNASDKKEKYNYDHFTFYKKNPELEIVSHPLTTEKYTVFTDFDNTLTENMTTFKLEYEDNEKKKHKTKIANDVGDADNNWAEIAKTFKAIKEDNNTDIVVVTSSLQKDIDETLKKENNDEAQKYKNVFTTISNNNSYPYAPNFKFSYTADSDKAVVIGIPDVANETYLQINQRSHIKFEQIDNYLRNTDNGASKKRSLFIDDDITNCNLIHEQFSEMLVIWAKNREDRPKKGNYLTNLKAMKLAIEYIKNNKDNEIIKMTDDNSEDITKNVKKLWTSERIIKFIEKNKEVVVVEDAGVVPVEEEEDVAKVDAVDTGGVVGDNKDVAVVEETGSVDTVLPVVDTAAVYNTAVVPVNNNDVVPVVEETGAVVDNTGESNTNAVKVHASKKKIWKKPEKKDNTSGENGWIDQINRNYNKRTILATEPDKEYEWRMNDIGKYTRRIKTGQKDGGRRLQSNNIKKRLTHKSHRSKAHRSKARAKNKSTRKKQRHIRSRQTRKM